MRVVAWESARQCAWQCVSEITGGAGDLARPRTGMGTASHAVERSFGIHKYNQRPEGVGGAPPG